MESRQEHFEQRATALSERATLGVATKDGATTSRLRPRHPTAVGVVLYLDPYGNGSVRLDDPAAVPAELGDDLEEDLRAIDLVIDVAVEGRATAFHLGRGGCIEESNDRGFTRSWMNAWPWPGWRRRAVRVVYSPYR